jgi:histidine triad (HIT) family protein
MDDCIFCKIVRGEMPADRIFEDDATFSFLTIGPNNPGHALVIPKSHASNIYEMADDSLASVIKSVKKLAKAVKETVHADGVNIIMNNEPAAGQVVFHAHIHVIPRHKDDGLKHWEQRYTYGEGEGQQLAQKISSAIS